MEELKQMAKEPYFDRKRINELSIILCFWNDKKLTHTNALLKIQKLFKPEFIDYWKAYDNKKNIKVWAKKIGLIRKS